MYSLIYSKQKIVFYFLLFVFIFFKIVFPLGKELSYDKQIEKEYLIQKSKYEEKYNYIFVYLNIKREDYLTNQKKLYLKLEFDFFKKYLLESVYSSLEYNNALIYFLLKLTQTNTSSNYFNWTLIEKWEVNKEELFFDQSFFSSRKQKNYILSYLLSSSYYLLDEISKVSTTTTIAFEYKKLWLNLIKEYIIFSQTYQNQSFNNNFYKKINNIKYKYDVLCETLKLE